MHEKSQGTLPRSQKGPFAPAPSLNEPLQTVIDAVADWPGITKSVHWHFSDHSRVDGVDFYFADEELGHVHLDGEIHLATNQNLAKMLIAEAAAKRFSFQIGWVEENIYRIGTVAAVALFRRNYERLQTAIRTN